MHSYSDFLRMKAHIPESLIGSYQKWVAQFERAAERSKSPINPTGGLTIRAFLGDLCRIHPSWEVNQARHALQLHAYYRGNRGAAAVRAEGPGSAPSAIDYENAMEELRRAIRLRHLAYRTEKSYLSWTARLLSYLGEKRGKKPDGEDLKSFLSFLAVDRKVSAATQRQAFNALLFYYRNVIGVPVSGLESVVRAKRGKRLPVVLSAEEVQRVLSRLRGTDLLMGTLIYGAGLRLEECLSLRIKDIDFERGCLTIRSGKGNKDRETVLPGTMVDALHSHLRTVKLIYERDRRSDVDGVWIPDALGRKYVGAGKEWAWFWVFPAQKLSIDPRSNQVRRFHVYPSTFQRTFKIAVTEAGILKSATVHTLRHYSASLTIAKRFDSTLVS